MRSGLRMFAALTPPDEAVEDLAEFLEPRRAAGAGLRWTPPEQWHLTLAFLADVPDRSLDDLVERLARAAGRRRPFPVSLRGGGAFPDVARGRVLFAGVDAGAAQTVLHRLSDSARAAANRSGATPDGARFHPHVTLARCGRPTDLVRWVRVLDTYAGPLWTADAVTLYSSHLGEGPGGRPRHEPVAVLPFGAGDAQPETAASAGTPDS